MAHNIDASQNLGVGLPDPVVYVVIKQGADVDDIFGPYFSLELARMVAQRSAMYDEHYRGFSWDVHQLSPEGMYALDRVLAPELGCYFTFANDRVLWEAYNEDEERTRGA